MQLLSPVNGEGLGRGKKHCFTQISRLYEALTFENTGTPYMHNALVFFKKLVSHSARRLKLNELAWASLDLYMGGLLLYFALRLPFGTSFWYTALLSSFIHWLLLPSFLFLPLLLIGRRWMRAALMLIFPIIFLHLFGGLFIPKMKGAQASDTQPLTVMTYNVVSDSLPADDLVEALRHSNADIIALQELGPWQAQVLESALLDEYPYRALSGGYVIGKGLLSRYPILDPQFVDLAEGSHNLIAHIQVGDRLISVFVAHPPAPGFHVDGKFFGESPLHAAQICALLKLASPDEPTLLLGDFNMTDQHESYALLNEAGFIDSFRAAGWGFGATFPAIALPFPLVRIDYIWSSPQLVPINSYVGEDAGSDHLPVISQFVWRK